jgi:hypothetical protein
MGKALEILCGVATAPGAVITALTMSSGLVSTVRNAATDSPIMMLGAWADSQAAGILQVRSPKLHDNVRGISMVTSIAEIDPLLPLGCGQRLYPLDTLFLGISGSAVAGDLETGCFLIYYPDLPGADARFISPEELKTRQKAIMGQTNTIATGVGGNFTGSQAINASADNWKSDTDYALVGYEVDVDCAAVRWIGADIANLGVGGPGNAKDKRLTSRWFIELSNAYGLNLIPVFSANNKSAILIDAAQDENGVDVVVTSIFVELADA